MTERRSDDELQRLFYDSMSAGAYGAADGRRAIYDLGVVDTVPDREALAKTIADELDRQAGDGLHYPVTTSDYAVADAVLALLTGGEKT